MNVRVLYFAILRERLGLNEEGYELEEGARVSDLLALLERRHGDVSEGVSSVRVAVNNEYVDSSRVLRDEDEVAIIPPVSGG